MSKLNILRANASFVRAFNNGGKEKRFSTLCFSESNSKENNFLVVKKANNIHKINTSARASNLAGRVREGNVLYSPFGDVNIPDKSLTEYIFQDVEHFVDLPAITCGATGRSYSYGMCQIMIQRCASALLAAVHLKPGDMIGIILPNIPEFVVIIHGALQAGLQVTFANPLYTEDEITRQFIAAGVKSIATIELLMPKALEVKNKLPNYMGTICIGEDDTAKEGIFNLKSLIMADHQAELPKIDLDGVALIPFSSGTTGLPKGVMLSHKNLVVNLEQVCHDVYLKTHKDKLIGNSETILTVPPFFHIYGFNGILNVNLRLKNHILTIPKFTPEDYIKCLDKYKPTGLFVVPSLLAFLANHPLVTEKHLSSVETVVIGAAPSTENMLEKFLNKCKKSRDELKLQFGFGMTESSPAISVTPFVYPRSKLGSVGQIVPGSECKVVSLTTGKTVGPNTSGEMMVRGPQVMKGYLNNEEATNETIDKDGWLHTGDVVHYDEDHFFFIVDRTKELIKVKGNQVSPTELENIIMEMPEVADAAVVGIPDHLAGELPKAFIVVRHGATLNEKAVYDWVKTKLVKYKWLEGGVAIIQTIPRNPGGKIMRNELKVLGGSTPVGKN